MALIYIASDSEGHDASPVTPDNPMPTREAGPDIVTVTASFARPGDTTQYAIADAVANSTTAGSVQPLTFGGMAVRGGGSGLITNVLLATSVVTITAASFRLYLLTAPLVAAFADNAAFNITWQEWTKIVGVLDFTLRTDGASATLAYAWDDSRRVDYVTVDGNLYGYLVAEATYTPAASTQFLCRLTAQRNP